MPLRRPALLPNVHAIMALVSNLVLWAAINFTQINHFICCLQVLGTGNNNILSLRPRVPGRWQQGGFPIPVSGAALGVQIWIWSALMEWPESYTTPPLERMKQVELLSVSRAGLEHLAGSACNLSSLRGADEGARRVVHQYEWSTLLC